jgi:hypothetical protein
LLTLDRARHGLQDLPNACYTCLQEEDNVDHVLVLCPYARHVWCKAKDGRTRIHRDPTEMVDGGPQASEEDR